MSIEQLFTLACETLIGASVILIAYILISNRVSPKRCAQFGLACIAIFGVAFGMLAMGLYVHY